MALTDLKVRTAKPTEKQQKLYDGGGLLLLITPAGGKRWVLKYRVDGKEKSLALGTYPDVSLAEARARRDSAREKLAAGVDPGEAKKADKRAAQLAAACSFEIVAREWFETQRGGWSEVYAGKVINCLEVDVFPRLGARPIASIDAPELLTIIRTVESRGVRETAKRVCACGIQRWPDSRGRHAQLDSRSKRIDQAGRKSVSAIGCRRDQQSGRLGNRPIRLSKSCPESRPTPDVVPRYPLEWSRGKAQSKQGGSQTLGPSFI